MTTKPSMQPEPDGGTEPTAKQRRMSRPVRFLLKFLVVIVGLVVAYKIAYPTATLRYRLTIEIQVGDELRTGSGVIETTYWLEPSEFLPIAGRWSSRVRGEAVAVHINEKDVLFLTVTGGSNPDAMQNPQFLPISMLRFDPANRSELRLLQWLDASAEIPFDKLPLLVRFRIIDVPQSVEVVSPHDLAASFGAGVRLKRVTIETTKDAVTGGIRSLLPWLDSHKGRLTTSPAADYSDPIPYISTLAFSRGEVDEHD